MLEKSKTFNSVSNQAFCLMAYITNIVHKNDNHKSYAWSLAPLSLFFPLIKFSLSMWGFWEQTDALMQFITPTELTAIPARWFVGQKLCRSTGLWLPPCELQRLWLLDINTINDLHSDTVCWQREPNLSGRRISLYSFGEVTPQTSKCGIIEYSWEQKNISEESSFIQFNMVWYCI